MKPSRSQNGCAPKSATSDAQPSALAEFVQQIAESDWGDTELSYLAVNTLHPHGATARQVKRDGASAIRTLQAILRDARMLCRMTSPVAPKASPLPTEDDGPGMNSNPQKEPTP